jgi:hypothetical protein
MGNHHPLRVIAAAKRLRRNNSGSNQFVETHEVRRGGSSAAPFLPGFFLSAEITQTEG